MAKSGKRERFREESEPLPDVDAYLFGDGLSFSDYCLSNGVISFKAHGQVYDLIIDHPGLADAAESRLRALGVGDDFEQ